MRGGGRLDSGARGVTLIELLVSITLLSLLSVGLLMTLRVGINAMDRANAKLMSNRRVASVERIMRSEIRDLIPVVATCVPGGDQPPERLMYFDGRPESLRFVSSYSLQEASRGVPRILDFQVMPGDRGVGVRLVVSELPYSPQMAGATCMGTVRDPDRGIAMGAFRPIPVGPGSFVLADKLAFCRFSYRDYQQPPLGERWLPEWPLGKWPTAVRIDMAPLDPDSARLPLMSLTVPMPVNRQPYEPYGQ
ncbi:MAG TPA: prepilin-type N-terminal cleavage/methylation domain-containing protein [Bryobacteraceae bacterium]|nr:prepilin-type N-terminal cleavage/methylation domain-containing protein [Bryobacteraceae bacterium]